MNHLPGKVELLCWKSCLQKFSSVHSHFFHGHCCHNHDCHFSHGYFSHGHGHHNHDIDQLASGEIEDMIETVDRNKDGKISYSEFRVIIVIVINKSFTSSIVKLYRL